MTEIALGGVRRAMAMNGILFDLELGVCPEGVLDSVADLPHWWVQQGG